MIRGLMTDLEWAYFEPFLVRRTGRPPPPLRGPEAHVVVPDAPAELLAEVAHRDQRDARAASAVRNRMDAGRTESRITEKALEDADMPAGPGHQDRPQLAAAPLERVVVGARDRRQGVAPGADDRRGCGIRDGRRPQRSSGASDRHAQDQCATEPAVATSTRILHLAPLLLDGLTRTARAGRYDPMMVSSPAIRNDL